MLLPKRARAISVVTLRQRPRWQHPNALLTVDYDADAFASQPPLTLPAGTAVTTSLSASFTINEGDHLLVCHAGIPNNSGHKLADSLASTSAIPDTTNVLHLSAHGAKLGAGFTNTLWDTSSTGFEARCRFAYFDRENFEVLTALSTPDNTSPYGPASFSGIVTTAGTGTDAGIGDVVIDGLVNYNWHEEGPIHIVRWTAGNAPPRTMIEAALEWMWYEWDRDNFILYPPLINYT